jgi:hypothetical protein
MFELKRGRLLDMRRRWRVKKPWFCVAKEGYPLFPMFFMRADSHTTWFPLGPGKAVAGLDRPLVLMLRPGLLHPPPGPGEGLRERDIWKPGVPVSVKWKAVSCLSLAKGGQAGQVNAEGGKQTRASSALCTDAYIPGIGESWLDCRWTPSLDEASSAPNDIFKPLPADERLRWCEGGLSWAEDDLAEFREEARLTTFLCSNRRADSPSGYHDYLLLVSLSARLGKT